MGGKVWSHEEEEVFWMDIIPKSNKRVGIDRLSDREVMGWPELAQYMVQVMGERARREYTALSLFEHYFQNVVKQRFSPHAGRLVSRYLLRMAEDSGGDDVEDTGDRPRRRRSNPRDSPPVRRSAPPGNAGSASQDTQNRQHRPSAERNPVARTPMAREARANFVDPSRRRASSSSDISPPDRRNNRTRPSRQGSSDRQSERSSADANSAERQRSLSPRPPSARVQSSRSRSPLRSISRNGHGHSLNRHRSPSLAPSSGRPANFDPSSVSNQASVHISPDHIANFGPHSHYSGSSLRHGYNGSNPPFGRAALHPAYPHPPPPYSNEHMYSGPPPYGSYYAHAHMSGPPPPYGYTATAPPPVSGPGYPVSTLPPVSAPPPVSGPPGVNYDWHSRYHLAQAQNMPLAQPTPYRSIQQLPNVPSFENSSSISVSRLLNSEGNQDSPSPQQSSGESYGGNYGGNYGRGKYGVNSSQNSGETNRENGDKNNGKNNRESSRERSAERADSDADAHGEDHDDGMFVAQPSQVDKPHSDDGSANSGGSSAPSS
ncbi:hypothetical protein B0T17DRAFT_42015 [Bombardia bombarda]|uniref:Uncharacterized protein n=1 Tax=Bombardia bombarda TaxID=252184 RepID=A0AA39XK27_9PEZI|nr:hypothetical protein B0T17DRAFT_42015 [Bombardia bombarda]